MDDTPPELIATRRGEAAALLRVNEGFRAGAVLTLTVAMLLAAAAGMLAIAAGESAVLMPVPAIVLLLCSLAFQQFAEVSVTGAARARLESAINSQLTATALIYETHVAQVRQRRPLVDSVRILQCVWAAGIVILLVAATIAAYEQPEAWVPALYSAFTLATLIACAASYRDMLRSGTVAAAAFEHARLP
jgi:hypothetical protein